MSDMLLMFSVGVVVAITLGAMLGTVIGRVAWWQGWTDDDE